MKEQRRAKRYIRLICIMLSACFFAACGSREETRAMLTELSDMVANAQVEAAELPHTNEAPGLRQVTSDKGTAVLDYSNAAQGYVMAKYTGDAPSAKAQIQGPGEKYTFNLRGDGWNAFPLSVGDGDYRVSLFENAGGSKYAQILTCSFSVAMEDEFAPFLRSNQFVNYEEAPVSAVLANYLTEGKTETLDKVAAVYEFVVLYLTYDKELAEHVTTGYVPDMDAVLLKGSGICFDYAALMTGMLRSLSVPCKLVVGYAGGAYHAWISVWVEGEGWIDNVIYFNGTDWKRMDPTFAAAGDNPDSLEQYVGDGGNYVAKFFY